MQYSEAVVIDPRLCIRCRGVHRLCGLAYCPLLARQMAISRVRPISGLRQVDGSTPPSVFVGHVGYPTVRVYPSTPPIHGDTSIFEDPSRWVSMRLEDFLASRLSMVRGAVSFRARDASNPPGALRDIQALAMSSRPIDVEFRFMKPISGRVIIDEDSPPFGPSAPMEQMRLGGEPKPPRVVERAYSDLDASATESIVELYRSGIDVHIISRLMSVGALGRGRFRRLVPTRWSITAVDKAVSDILIDRVKDYPELGEYRVYVREFMGNLFVAILIPHTWMYEWGEAWWPKTTWNVSEQVAVELDWEGYRGRRDYPSIGGCYYAARLSAAEALESMRRQAAVAIWREIYPGFNIPVGVWFVRENVRAMFKGPYASFSSLEESLSYVSRFLKLGLRQWLSKSYVTRAVRGELLGYG